MISHGAMQGVRYHADRSAISPDATLLLTRTSTLTLPDWLREIVDRTQSELDAAA